MDTSTKGSRKRKRSQSQTKSVNKRPKNLLENAWKKVELAGPILDSAEGGFLNFEQLDVENYDAFITSLGRAEELPEPESKPKQQKGKQVTQKQRKEEQTEKQQPTQKQQTGKKQAAQKPAPESSPKPAKKQPAEKQQLAEKQPGQKQQPGKKQASQKPTPESSPKPKRVRKKKAPKAKPVEPLIVDVPENVEDDDEESIDEEAEALIEQEDPTKWISLGVHDLLIKGLAARKYTKPSPIQIRSIPAGLHYKKDIVGAAETGSGKTLAFGIPILNQLQELHERQEFDQATKKLPCLIVSPTRELAMQIVEHLKAIAKFTKLMIIPVVGGLAVPKQERLLSKKPDIVVATPGRLWELISTHNPYLRDLSELRFFVADEADRLIEKNHFVDLRKVLDFLRSFDEERLEEEDDFVPEGVKEILEANAEEGDDDMDGEDEQGEPEEIKKPKKSITRTIIRQTFVFSATMTITMEGRRKIGKKAPQKKKRKQKAPGETLDELLDTIDFKRKVEVIDTTSQKKGVSSSLVEAKIDCQEKDKDLYLYYFLLRYPGRTLVFANSISCLRRLVPIFQLLSLGDVWVIHAQMQQRQRLKNLERFKASKKGVLLSTDVLARGVDIPEVEHVIHYQVPRTTEVYVHRSGRTARANTEGVSILLVSPEELGSYRKIVSVLDGNPIMEFPIDTGYFRPLKQRVQVAIEIDRIQNRKQKATAQDNWMQKTAAAMDIDIDDGKKVDHSEKARLEKIERGKLQGLKNQLADLLKTSLLPRGVSPSYYSARLEHLQKPASALDDLRK